MRLIVGLGNHPPKYRNTRHNFGFMAVEALAEKFNFSEWKLEKKFHAVVSYGQIDGEKIILCKPQTFMNVSGQAVGSIQRFYKIPIEDLFIISDDLDQDFGSHRFRERGTSGGQKGLEHIIEVLGTDQFARLKFGISNENRSYFRTEDFVLSQFTPEEREQIPKIIEEGCKKLLDVL